MPTITCSWAWLCASCFWKPSQGRHGACQVQSKQQRDQRGHLLLLGTALWFLPVCPSSSRSAPYRMKTSLYNSQCKTWFQTRDKVRGSKTSALVCLLHKGLITREREITPKLESPHQKPSNDYTAFQYVTDMMRSYRSPSGFEPLVPCIKLHFKTKTPLDAQSNRVLVPKLTGSTGKYNMNVIYL